MLEARVGAGRYSWRDGYPSIVTFYGPMSGTTVTANGGQPSRNPYNIGGAGYSGGGGRGYDPDYGCTNCGSWGGRDGSKGYDGNCGVGGSGTGENIRSYALSHFTLSPGYYGEPKISHGVGGGGGGVMVDGNGPSALTWHGQGYGGGGGYDPGNSGGYSTGLDGVILLEVV